MKSAKAKILKKIMIARGEYSDTPEYVVSKEKVIAVPVVNAQGQVEFQPLKKQTLVNKSKHAYRLAKKLYDQGLLKL